MQTVTLPARIRKIDRVHVKAEALGFERLDVDSKVVRAALSHAIKRQLRNSWSRSYAWATDGTTFVLYYCDGWRYDIIGKAHAEAGMPCTVSLPTHGDNPDNPDNGSYHEALAIMARHARNYCGTEGGAE